MATVTLTPASFDDANSVYLEVVSDFSNAIGKDHTSEASAEWSLVKGNNAVTNVYYRFDTSAIPANAVIDSVLVEAKGLCEATSGQSVLSLVSGVTQIGANSGTGAFGTNAAVCSLDPGAVTREQLENAGILLSYTRGGSFSSTNRNMQFYGASLQVAYTLPDIPAGHKCMINGTVYAISGGRTLVGGTGYDIAKGRTLAGGTGYDIAFGVPIGTLPVGTIVKMPVNGVIQEFIIVHQGNPDSTLYASSCDGTWLLMKDIFTTYQYASSGSNRYAPSDVRAYLENTFASYLSISIKQVKIPYVNNWTAGAATGENGLLTTVFLLSSYEIGGTNAAAGVDGAKLDYFTDSASRKALYNGSALHWWLRSPVQSSSNNSVKCVTNTGATGGNYGATLTSPGVRPACIVTPETLVNPSDYTIIG